MQIDVPGGQIHAVEQGEGPLVLLVHGFPDTSCTWRHQLPALAAAGYRAVAIDVRGYGRSLRPEPIEAYRMLAHVADNVAVVAALGASTATVIGHDWGSPIAATSALARPDVFTAWDCSACRTRRARRSVRPRPSRWRAAMRRSTSATSRRPVGRGRDRA